MNKKVKLGHRMEVSEELRKQLAWKYMTSTNKTALAQTHGITIRTILNVIGGKQKKASETTMEKLESIAKGKKTAVKENQSSKNDLQEPKERLATLKSKNASDSPQPTAVVSGASQIASPSVPNDPNEVDALRQQVTLLKSTVNQLMTAYELNKDLTSQLIEQVNRTTKWMNEDTQHSLDNFMKHNEKLTDEIKNLDDNFKVLMKRHNALTHDNADIKQDLKTIGIKLWPANVNKLKTTQVTNYQRKD